MGFFKVEVVPDFEGAGGKKNMQGPANCQERLLGEREPGAVDKRRIYNLKVEKGETSIQNVGGGRTKSRGGWTVKSKTRSNNPALGAIIDVIQVGTAGCKAGLVTGSKETLTVICLGR